MERACDFDVHKDSAFFCILDEQNKKLLEKLAKRYFERKISLMCTIPGIQKYSAMSILSEIGNDMSSFGKASHLIGWQDCVPETMNRPARYSRVKPCTGTNIFARC